MRRGIPGANVFLGETDVMRKLCRGQDRYRTKASHWADMATR
jgi:hypothetical protein